MSSKAVSKRLTSRWTASVLRAKSPIVVVAATSWSSDFGGKNSDGLTSAYVGQWQKSNNIAARANRPCWQVTISLQAAASSFPLRE
ncbi:MAG: hypothetical protein N2C12_03145 [Planctomycetales bacterium]